MSTITIRDVPDELRKRLRLIAVERDTSMNKILNQLIRDYVEYEESQKSKKS